ncbi:MAG TPA: YbhB/YbcL family Raf kinase inhibitor-like protein [Candidatus Acidoferrales bacterium]|nr:YbhB/YbcL family Raf kinase inhibitor-like protein [Candidatus Acidoferrales bacterium]
MLLRSPSFPSGGAVPAALMAADCGGKNRTPALAWSGAPHGTKSFAVIMHDADAPIAGGFYHWVLYDVPGSVTRLSGGAAAPGRLGVASTGRAAYYGPCPPPGPAHHYTVTLLALDLARVSATAPLDAPQLLHAVAGHVLARATIAATATRP